MAPISGNPVELVRAFDFLPVYPEVNALQLGVRRQSLPLILKAEERGYSIDNCAYVKADIGLYFNGLKAPFATIPEPALILCNYVGCGVYLQCSSTWPNTRNHRDQLPRQRSGLSVPQHAVTYSEAGIHTAT